MIIEIGFDEITAFFAYCYCSGNIEAAVNTLLSGGLVIQNTKSITNFIIAKYPDAVQQVRPALLRKRVSFGDGRRRGRLDDLLMRAYLSGQLSNFINPDVCYFIT